MKTCHLQDVQDAKTFPKCYVGRNGKRNQQKLHIQVYGSLKTQRNQGWKSQGSNDKAQSKQKKTTKKTTTDVAAMLSVNPAGQVHTMTVTVVSVRRVQECMIL